MSHLCIDIIFSSAQNSNHTSGMRTGFYYNFKQKEMLVKKWDKYNEGEKVLIKNECFIMLFHEYIYLYVIIMACDILF